MKHCSLVQLFIFTSTGLIRDGYKDEYKLQLQTSETMKLLGSIEKLIKVVEVVLSQFSRQSISTKAWGIIYFYAQ